MNPFHFISFPVELHASCFLFSHTFQCYLSHASANLLSRCLPPVSSTPPGFFWLFLTYLDISVLSCLFLHNYLGSSTNPNFSCLLFFSSCQQTEEGRATTSVMFLCETTFYLQVFLCLFFAYQIQHWGNGWAWQLQNYFCPQYSGVPTQWSQKFIGCLHNFLK